MTRFFAPLILLLPLLAAACTKTSPPVTGSAVNVAPPQSGQSGVLTNWTRPMNVAPLTQPFAAADTAGGKMPAGEGSFDIISDTPWPGNKVRVFFFGVAG